MPRMVEKKMSDEFARSILKQFVMLNFEETIAFKCIPNTGDIIIQRMRVRLSRLRTKAKKRGKVLQEFKMIKVKTEEGTFDDGKQCEVVTLKKTKNSITDVQEAFHQVMTEFP